MAKITLTRGRIAKVDDEDFVELNRYPWYCTAQGYASTGKYPNNILMHRLIMNCPEGMVVDHINGDTTDNRKENLRIVKHRHNLLNTGKMKSNSRGITSKYKGVSLDKRSGKYQVRCSDLEGKQHSGGAYTTEKEAALAYNALAIKWQGSLAKLNEVEE